MRRLLDMVLEALPSLSLDVWVEASTPRQQMLVLISSERLRRISPRMIHETLPSLQVSTLPLKEVVIESRSYIPPLAD